MAKDCLICPYCEIPLGDIRIHCHHPLRPTELILPFYRTAGPGKFCPMENGLDESIIERAFLDDHCKVATCTGLSYSTFKRIAEYFYKLGKDDRRNV